MAVSRGQGRARLYGDGRYPTPDGRARFHDLGYRPPVESVSAHYPLKLTTGRLRDHWHTLARTSLARVLTQHVDEPWVSLHPEDMRRLRLAPGALARLKSRRGSIVLPARPDEGLRPGQAFLPMHWGSAYMAGLGVNALTHDAADPISRQPELKHAAISAEPAKLTWRACGWIQGDGPALRARLAPWLGRYDYAVVLPAAVGGARLQLGAADAPTARRWRNCWMPWNCVVRTPPSTIRRAACCGACGPPTARPRRSCSPAICARRTRCWPGPAAMRRRPAWPRC